MIAIGSDHGGFTLKEEIKKYLDEIGIEYKDFGCDSEERTDYPMYAKAVSESVQNNEAEKGILICSTGAGMAIVANKFKGIRCVDCWNEEIAKLSKAHNNANIIALPGKYLNTSEAIVILRTWLATEFMGSRHSDRLQMIETIENKNMK